MGLLCMTILDYTIGSPESTPKVEASEPKSDI